MSTPRDILSAPIAKITAFRRALKVKAAYREVFGSDAGRIVLHDLARRGGLAETSFEPADPHWTAFREGRRSLFLDIVQQLRWTEGELAQLAVARDPDALAAVAEAEAG